MYSKLLSGLSFRAAKVAGVSSPLQTTGNNQLMCASIRAGANGLENPRAPLEAPETWMTLVKRQRQLHDEDKSCGTQPAYIRVIYRRLGCACPVPSVHHCSVQIKPPGYPLDRFTTYQRVRGDFINCNNSFCVCINI